MTYEELVNSKKPIGNMNNDELITYCSGLLDEIWEYDKRFDKAIEYIEENSKSYSLPNTIKDMRYVNFYELLDILKGSDKE